MPKYRVLAGTHRIPHPTIKKPNGANTYVVHEAGDYFETDRDMDLLNPLSSNLKRKFEKVSDDVETKLEKMLKGDKAEKAPEQANDGLELMEIGDLKKLAEEEEINLGKAKGKAAIIKKIRNAHISG